MAESYRVLFKGSPATKVFERKAYTYLGLTLTAVSVFGAFAIRPTLASIISLSQKNKELLNLEKSFDTKIAALTTARENLNKVKDDLPLVQETLPSQEAFPELLESLNVIASKNEVAFTSLGFSKVKFSNDSPNLVVIPFRIAIEGSFWQVTATIREIEESFQLIKIKEINIQGGNETETVTATLSAETYAFSPQEPK